jgi:hypothetical protein
VAYRLFKKRDFLRFVAAACFKAIFALESHIFVKDPKFKSAFDTHMLILFMCQKYTFVHSNLRADWSIGIVKKT